MGITGRPCFCASSSTVGFGRAGHQAVLIHVVPGGHQQIDLGGVREKRADRLRLVGHVEERGRRGAQSRARNKQEDQSNKESPHHHRHGRIQFHHKHKRSGAMPASQGRLVRKIIGSRQKLTARFCLGRLQWMIAMNFGENNPSMKKLSNLLFLARWLKRLRAGWLLLAAAPVVALAAHASQNIANRAQLGAGDPAWLAYRAVDSTLVFGAADQIPDTIAVLGPDATERSAGQELARGWQGMLNHVPRVIATSKPEADSSAEGIVVVGTQAEMRAWRPSIAAGPELGADAYRLHRAGNILLVEGGDARGALYGAFALLREIAQEHSLRSLDESSRPWAAVRWTNEWDNPNGTIERGYAGPSIFFEDGHVRADLSRAAAYARLACLCGRRRRHHQQCQCRSSSAAACKL